MDDGLFKFSVDHVPLHPGGTQDDLVSFDVNSRSLFILGKTDTGYKLL